MKVLTQGFAHHQVVVKIIRFSLTHIFPTLFPSSVETITELIRFLCSPLVAHRIGHLLPVICEPSFSAAHVWNRCISCFGSVIAIAAPSSLPFSYASEAGGALMTATISRMIPKTTTTRNTGRQPDRFFDCRGIPVTIRLASMCRLSLGSRNSPQCLHFLATDRIVSPQNGHGRESLSPCGLG